MADVPPVYDQLGKIIVSSKRVRQAIDAKRARVQAEAERIAAAEAPEVHIGTADGVRPGVHADDRAPRMFARVEAPMDQEFGTRFVEIRRILGRSRDA
jgi:hypothetical protein